MVPGTRLDRNRAASQGNLDPHPDPAGAVAQPPVIASPATMRSHEPHVQTEPEAEGPFTCGETARTWADSTDAPPAGDLPSPDGGCAFKPTPLPLFHIDFDSLTKMTIRAPQIQSRMATRPIRRDLMTRVLFLPAACAVLGLISGASATHAWSPSPDVGLTLNSASFTRGDVIEDGAAPSAPPIDLGPLPEGADVVAFTMYEGGARFFVLGHTMELPGGVIANPQTSIRYENSVYSVQIDLGDALPDGVAIDALGLTEAGLAFSFDTTVDFAGFILDDADVVDIYSGVILDASAAGVPTGVDVDAFAQAGNGDLLVSFDTGGTVGSVAFADEDVLRVTPGYAWSIEVDASSLDVAWERADVDALHPVPEPGTLLQLIAGGLCLAGLERRRSGRISSIPSRGETS